MEKILRETIENYLQQKQLTFAGNYLANKLRNDYPTLLLEIIPDKTRYKVIGSAGKGKWTDNPWIAILDVLITETPQSGYYPVFLFKADMSGVYLSLNQGITEVREYYKNETRNILSLRANDFRAKISLKENDLLKIDLNSQSQNAKFYEAGNIISRYYPADNLPIASDLITDILYYLHLYDELTFNDSQFEEKKNLTAIEKKQYRLHFRIERNSNISKKVKEAKGYICEACNFKFEDKYGNIGRKFIEAHHLTPLENLDIGKFKINVLNDFVVLCSNCHSMIHKLDDPSNVELLRKKIKDNLLTP